MQETWYLRGDAYIALNQGHAWLNLLSFRNPFVQKSEKRLRMDGVAVWHNFCAGAEKNINCFLYVKCFLCVFRQFLFLIVNWNCLTHSCTHTALYTTTIECVLSKQRQCCKQWWIEFLSFSIRHLSFSPNLSHYSNVFCFHYYMPFFYTCKWSRPNF